MSISRTGSATVRTGDDRLVVISAEEADHSGICPAPGDRITFRIDPKAVVARAVDPALEAEAAE